MLLTTLGDVLHTLTWVDLTQNDVSLSLPRLNTLISSCFVSICSDMQRWKNRCLRRPLKPKSSMMFTPFQRKLL